MFRVSLCALRVLVRATSLYWLLISDHRAFVWHSWTCSPRVLNYDRASHKRELAFQYWGGPKIEEPILVAAFRENKWTQRRCVDRTRIKIIAIRCCDTCREPTSHSCCCIHGIPASIAVGRMVALQLFNFIQMVSPFQRAFTPHMFSWDSSCFWGENNKLRHSSSDPRRMFRKTLSGEPQGSGALPTGSLCAIRPLPVMWAALMIQRLGSELGPPVPFSPLFWGRVPLK